MLNALNYIGWISSLSIFQQQTPVLKLAKEILEGNVDNDWYKYTLQCEVTTTGSTVTERVRLVPTPIAGEC